MPSLEAIIQHLMYRRSAGRNVLLSPHTTEIVERALRQIAAPPSPSIPEKLPFRIDEWDKTGNNIVQTHGWLGVFYAGEAAYQKIIEASPRDFITLRHGAHVLKQQNEPR